MSDNQLANTTAKDGSMWIGGEPKVLVFDVNETLIDFESMNRLFERLFDDKRVMREWLGHLIMYSMTFTLAGLWKDYYSLGAGLLKMVGTIHGKSLTDADAEEIMTAMKTMPAHPDVVEGLKRLKDDGFRLITLTNSPLAKQGEKSPLERAGLGDLIERQFSIETVRAYKPLSSVYHMVAQDLGVQQSNCLMVAAHVWDTVGAQAAGFTSALITRPGNAPLELENIPWPTIITPDIKGLADELHKRWR